MIIVKGVKDIYDRAAERLGIDADRIASVANFTWDDLNKRISNLQHREIYVLGLGTFTLRKLFSERFISNIGITKINKYARNEYKRIYKPTEEKIKKDLETKEKLLPLIDEWNQIKYDREKFNERKLNGTTNEHIQKS